METAGSASRELALLREVVDQLPAMVAYWDQDARNVFGNAAYVEWFGRRPDQMRGLHISDLLGPDVYAKNLPFIRGALAGQEQLFERTLVDQSGRTRHTQASYVPHVVDGSVRGFFVLVTDVTPRVTAQEAMDEAQELARLGSWTFTPSTGEITWSRELFRIVGRAPAEGVPASLEEVSAYMHPEDQERVLAAIGRAAASADRYSHEYRVLRPDGTEREVVSKGRPVLGPDGAVLRLTGTLQDVTEANALTRELNRINGELRRANELNADVIAMLGHDLRTPLSAVRGFVELLDDDEVETGPDQRRALLRKAIAAVERTNHTVEKILALAAVDAGVIEPHAEVLALALVLHDVVELCGLDGSVVLDFHDPAARICFDRVHLEQIVANLLTNAVRYGAAPVRIRSRAAAGGCVVAVSDAGGGVPASQVPQLFQRFARTGSRQASAGGSGFGLYMAARLSAANGGALTYDAGSARAAHEFRLAVPGAPCGST